MAKAKNVQLVKASAGKLAQPMEDWEIEIAAKAKDEKAAEVTGVPRITHRGGIFKIDDKKVEGNSFRAAVLGYGLAKLYYESGFDPDSPAATPVCYAFASSAPGAETKMVPHEAAPDKQHETCTGCPHNAFGTADRGRGKRCSDTRRVMLIMGSDDPGSIAKSQVRQLSIPAGSLKPWGNYLRSLDDQSPYGVRGVITEFGIEGNEKGGHTLTFTAVERLDKEFVRALYAKWQQVEQDIHAPFPVLEQEESPKKGRKKVKGQD